MSLLEAQEWLLGAVALGTFAAGLFFLRFYKITRDRLFLLFACAFFVEVASRILMALSAAASEEHPVIYVLRLISYGLIAFGVIQKNRDAG
ncbi:conserved membrane protein of unknown function [Nitrospira sp. KM1]|uniref:DUF5985 family protein n=1 Tax=Nitrospira sp. KM1 TaxID=1936990 RepID=UPI0013A72DBA|nr:DUF5985 family protein [Nitrospira sp. KM1]BCA56094.1 conserved membrane protein of unknown function [Nitrospira sp. KM1]